MKKEKRFVLIFLLCSILLGCASGSIIVTGTPRKAIDPYSVVIYAEPPIKYEVIGFVSASSDMGWTEQDCVNYAIEELKKQAAKVGANGVLIEKIGTDNSGGVVTNGVYIPISAKTISGKAIYVQKDTNSQQ